MQKPKPTTEDLTHEDYYLRYMSTPNQTLKTRITLKASGKSFDGKQESFLALWTKHVTPATDTVAEFKGAKLILHNYRPDFGLSFSKDFSETFVIHEPFFGKGSRWANNTSLLSRDMKMKNATLICMIQH